MFPDLRMCHELGGGATGMGDEKRARGDDYPPTLAVLLGAIPGAFAPGCCILDGRRKSDLDRRCLDCPHFDLRVVCHSGDGGLSATLWHWGTGPLWRSRHLVLL